jgi:hypothetical protein
MEELVRGTRSDGSGESRTEAISLGLFKGQAREIGTRKQQQGERERERRGKRKGRSQGVVGFRFWLESEGKEGREERRRGGRTEMVVAS